MDAKDVVVAAGSRRSKSPDITLAEPDIVRGVLKGTPNGLRSSPPILAADAAMDIDPPNGSARDGADKSDSEAETIVLPGKDGHSPSKVRKSIKHEDRSDDEEMKDASDSRDVDADHEMEKVDMHSESNAASILGKRKRSKHGAANDDTSHLGNSSGLSSVPTSPVATTRSSLSKPAASDSEISKSPSPPSRSRSAVRDKAKSVDRAFPRRNHSASVSEREDESPTLEITKQRSSGENSKSNRDNRLAKHTSEAIPRKRTRSSSPHVRSHKRSVSNQLPSKSGHGLSHKKKRIPAPLQSTEYHSDESSASGNSHPRSSRLRSLAAPTTGDSTISPAKMAPHKKHVNSSGQTQLAIACNRGRLEAVKQRYEDRPSDLNIPDHALNTPLHIASLAGGADIVKFLIDTGHCELDPINLEKDTPLHDAVDNKHIEVVKLLLEAGANPNIPNKNQNEPLDLLELMLDQEDGEDDDEDEQEREAAKMEIAEMRKAILAAKRKYTGVRRGSEDHQMQDHAEDRESHPKESPRHTPPAHESVSSGLSNRRTARSMMKTKERTLWMGYTVEELRAAATEGDVEFTNQFLQVKSEVNDPRTLYNAARGGHDAIINLLFALGKFNPDPAPLDGLPNEQATPILATIGKDDHLEVLKLFLGNSDFDPTRKIRGETYHEIARRRAGPKWQEEVQVLKDAFEAYQRSYKPSSTNKSRSPGLRRDGREAKKSARPDDAQGMRIHKRSTSNPKAKELDLNKNQQKHSSSLNHSKDSYGSGKRGPGRPKKDEDGTSNALSDRETSPLGPPKQKLQLKKHDSELVLTSDNEPAAKPRRKLVSGKKLRDERELEKQRRASIASNASTISVKDKRERGLADPNPEKPDGKASPNLPRVTKVPSVPHERELATEKHSSDKDRARSLKRDDSKDRLTAIRSESPVKRPRKSETPPRSGMQEVTAAYDSGEAPKKRRKLDGDAKGKKGDETSSSSPEHRVTMAKSSISVERHKVDLDSKHKPRSIYKSGEARDTNDTSNVERTSPSRPAKVKGSNSIAEPPAKKPKLHQERHGEDSVPARSVSANSEEEGAQRQLQIRRQKKEAEALRLKEVEEEKERETKKEEERERGREREKERIESAKQARLAREQAEKEEQARRDKEEADRKEHQRIADAIAHAHAEEEARLRYEEQERLKREEADRRRAAHAEQQRAERARIDKQKREECLSKLPLLLKWFDMIEAPKSVDVANLFKTIIGYRYDTIQPEACGQASGREQWMLNTHAALLLGEKDLQLSRYTAWDRIHLSQPQKAGVWMNNSTDGLYSLFIPALSSVRKQLANKEPGHVVIEKNKALFLGLDLFFLKVSEFMFIVPNFPHLRNIEMEVRYQELREPQSPSKRGQPLESARWKNDPETSPDQIWAPRPKFYLNGAFVRQAEVLKTRILKKAPPPDTFPRREGITRVHESDPDYEEQCRKQGLHDRLLTYQSPVSSNNPHQGDIENHEERVNGITPPMSDRSKSVSGGSPHRTTLPESNTSQAVPNGVKADDPNSPTII